MSNYESEIRLNERERFYKVINDIREWINSANRGNCDHLIIDRIEQIIHEYENEVYNGDTRKR